MPNSIRKIGAVWRVVEKKTGKITKNAGGKPVDGGGYFSKEHAMRQAATIHMSQHKRNST